METIKEEKKAEWEKELVYKPIYLPVRFFKKEAYIHIDDYKEAINKRKNAVNRLEEENKKLKDEFMLRLAKAYLLLPTSNQMAEYKKWNYSKWYDEIKNQMRKEIKEGK